MAKLEKIIAKAKERRASDIHIAPALPVRIRVDGALEDLDERVLTADDCLELAVEAAGESYKKIKKGGELDLAGTYAGDIRCRLNIYRSMRGVCMAIRILSSKIPELTALGLPPIVQDFPRYQDVILIGEMRDLDTIETALTAAETGHLVFGTLHTQSAADSIDRLVDVFPENRQRQIRLQLSMVLQAVLSQQLLPRAGGEGRAVACEVMIVNHAIRNLIREGKTPQIENTLATTAEIGAVTMDNMLIQMVRTRAISRETAIQAARDPEFVKRNAR